MHTLIVLPAEEKVANVFAGDTVNWIFDGGHVASRFISVVEMQRKVKNLELQLTDKEQQLMDLKGKMKTQ